MKTRSSLTDMNKAMRPLPQMLPCIAVELRQEGVMCGDLTDGQDLSGLFICQEFFRQWV